MKYYYQVVTTPTADTPGSAVVLNFPDKRYLFGQVAEGTQRACAGTSVKFGLMTDIFLTGRLEMSNVGGLFGVILTLADGLASAAANLSEKQKKKEADQRQQRPKQDSAEGKADGLPISQPGSKRIAQRGTLTVHGGKNLTHLMATARKFIFRQGLPMYMQEHDGDSLAGQRGGLPDPYEQPTWSDQNIKVWVMAVSPESHSQPKAKRTRKRSHEEFREEDKAGVEEEKAAALAEQVIRQNVVSNMFNSTWKLDALHETKLKDVQMPGLMFVRDPVTKDLRRYTGPTPGGRTPVPDITVLVRKPWPGANVERIPPVSWNEDAISYIVRNHNIRGKFDPLKAQALKVRRGPDYATLTRGDSVISEDGQIITPDMVLDEEKVGKGVAIIDLPSRAYVENLVNRPEWDSPTAALNLEAFIWILGPRVGDHPKLREFVAKMSHCTHTVSSPDYCPDYLAMKEVAESTVQMAMVRPDNYALPAYDNVTVPQVRLFNDPPTKKRAPLRPLEPGLIINMEPTFEIDESEITPRYDPRNAKEKLPKAVETQMKIISGQEETPEFQDKLAAFRKDLPGADVEFITLGTGSSVPSKHRNVSSTLIHAPGHGYYLLDCGEGTLGQLKRVFGTKALREVFQNMRMIWISHLHADHHLGIANVIKAWYQANYPNGVPRTDVIEEDMSKILRDKRLFVVCEQMMTTWLEEYASVEDYGFQKVTALSAFPEQIRSGIYETSFVYRHCRADGTFPGQREAQSQPKTTKLRFQDDSDPLSALLREAIGLSDILPSRVSHCRGSMAVTLVYPDGFKLSFSGDCRPSENFAATGRGSTVLIHEATFQNDMAGSAIAKKHSTYAEALEVARQMQARALLLTHFSQRYQGTVTMNNGQSSQKAQDEAGSDSSASLRTKDVPDDEEGLAEESSPQLEGSNEDAGGVIIAKPSTQYNGPYVNAFDYMRLRVGDFPVLQAYVPAMEMLFAILERAAAESAEKAQQQKAAKKENSKLKAAKKENSKLKAANKKTQETEKTGKAGMFRNFKLIGDWSANRSRKASASAADEMDVVTQAEKPGKAGTSGEAGKNGKDGKAEGIEGVEMAADRSRKASVSSADEMDVVAEAGTAQEDGNPGIIRRVGIRVEEAVNRALTASASSADKTEIDVSIEKAERAAAKAQLAQEGARAHRIAAERAAQASIAAAEKVELDVHSSIERAEAAADKAEDAGKAARAAKDAADRAAQAFASSPDEIEMVVDASNERAERAAERAEMSASRAARAEKRAARHAAGASSLPTDESDEDRNAKRALRAEKRAARRAARASASASSADEMEVDSEAGKARRSRSPRRATAKRAGKTSASSADEMEVDPEAGKARSSTSPRRAPFKRAGKASASSAFEIDKDAKKPRARSRSKSRASGGESE